MGLCFNVLGSGSTGNSTLVSDGVTNILVDAGFSGREMVRRVGEYGLAPEKISAIVVSHHHIDHCCGIPPFIKKLDIPVFMTEAEFELPPDKNTPPLKDRVDPSKQHCISPGKSFDIGRITVTGFSVQHRSAQHEDEKGYKKELPYNPLGFVFEKSGVRIGIAIDLGYISNLVKERLKGCAGIVLESNYDVAMLKAGPYPWAIKQRIMGKHGHLSNEDVADYLKDDFDGSAAHVVLAHLSKQNNLPDLALLSARQALEKRPDINCVQTKIELSYPDKISKTYRY